MTNKPCGLCRGKKGSWGTKRVTVKGETKFVAHWYKCGLCKGTGAVPRDSCGTCRGSGKVRDRQTDRLEPCRTCGGKGFI